MDKNGDPVLDSLGDAGRYKPERTDLRSLLAVTAKNEAGKFNTIWEPRHPIPLEEYWFETIWGEYLSKDVFRRSQV